ncbi:MAG TPA: glycosyltransferase family 4 protein [Candidatus Acidoferrum sp.]|nr:glycosyltransferase family 4 protein [Candidatus Acidoferrum sp.]
MRIAVVSPFLDRQHGTERCIVEQIEHFLRQPGCEIHIYAQSIRDLEVVRSGNATASRPAPGKAVWHRIPAIPGPHLLNFLWWYFANQALRWFHRKFRALRFDLVFSPGINCADAGAIVVHIVFHEFFRLVQPDLRLRHAPLSSWPVLLHRILYYRLIMALENRIYRKPRVRLAAVSQLTASELSRHFFRRDVTVIPNAADLALLNLPERLRRREQARLNLQLPENAFVLLLIGNDWKKKGLTPLLNAIAALPDIPIRLLVVGRDDRTPFLAQIRQLHLDARVLFLEPSADIMQFYAAADVYTGPSLHDSFALPPMEAMASGLPVVTSVTNGGSQIISEGKDGFVLSDAHDTAALSRVISLLYEHPDIRRSVGEQASRTAQSYSWERNAAETWEFVRQATGSSSDV